MNSDQARERLSRLGFAAPEADRLFAHFDDCERRGKLGHGYSRIQWLATLDDRQSRLVEMRFFGGLELQEIAAELSVSESTVKRDWNVAKAWLARELKGERHGGKSPTVAED